VQINKKIGSPDRNKMGKSGRFIRAAEQKAKLLGRGLRGDEYRGRDKLSPRMREFCLRPGGSTTKRDGRRKGRKSVSAKDFGMGGEGRNESFSSEKSR